MKDIKIVKSLEGYILLMQDASETIENESKEQISRFICMLLAFLGANLLGNLSTGKRVYVNSNNVTYFASFGLEYIPKEIKKFVANKNTTKHF